MEHKKLSNNDIITLIIVLILAIGLICQIVINKQNNNLVGKEIVIDNDTLRVTSYLEHHNIYHVSNGTLVNKKYIKKNSVNEKD